MECERIVIYLLKEAYSVEQAIIEVLEEHVDLTDDIELKSRLEEKIVDLQGQAEKVKNRVEALDEEVSYLRSGFASPIISMLGIPQNGREQILRNTLVEYTLDYFEKGIFKMTLTAARECKDDKTEKLCDEIIGDSREHSELLDNQIIATITDYINREVIEKEEIDFTGEDEFF